MNAKSVCSWRFGRSVGRWIAASILLTTMPLGCGADLPSIEEQETLLIQVVNALGPDRDSDEISIGDGSGACGVGQDCPFIPSTKVQVDVTDEIVDIATITTTVAPLGWTLTKESRQGAVYEWTNDRRTRLSVLLIENNGVSLSVSAR